MMLVDSLNRFARSVSDILSASYPFRWWQGEAVALGTLFTAVAVTILVVVIIAIALKSLGRLRSELQGALPDLFSRKLIKVLNCVIWVSLLGVAGYIIPLAWGVDLGALLSFQFTRRLLGTALTVIVIVSCGLLIWYLLNRLLIKISATSPRRGRTLFHLAQGILTTVTLILVALTILHALGINIAFVMAGFGIFGLAVGLASQALIRDFINCFLFIADDVVQVGDVVKIKDLVGTVEMLNFRTLRLRNLAGELHVIPYGWIDCLTNLTPGKREVALIDIAVAYEENVDRVIDAIKAVVADMSSDPVLGKQIQGDPVVLGVNALAASSVVVRFLIPAASGQKWSITRAFYMRMQKHLKKLGIAFPYPRQELFLRSGNGQSGKDLGALGKHLASEPAE